MEPLALPRMTAVKFLFWSIIWVALFLCSLWAVGALYFDFPLEALRLPVAISFVITILAIVIFASGRKRKGILTFAAFIIVVLWWFSLKPKDSGQWQPDVAQTAWAEIEGDLVTIHNVRNCEYRTENDYTPNWETRSVHLSQINGMDIAITYWGSPWIAHPIISFRFGDALPLSFSIETRKRIGQEYSALRGFYRQFTLTYIPADERDLLRLRTNYRKGEEVYLYRLIATPEATRQRFLEYVQTLNELHSRPRWYNAVTTNCTTAIRTQRPANERMPWDWRILLNGKGDELLYEHHLIATAGLSLHELKERSHINDRARAADHDPEFSQRIREGLPGFEHRGSD